jgi:hypothetical protein
MGTPVGLVQCDCSSGPDESDHLGNESFRLRDVHEHEARGCEIERLVGEGSALRVPSSTWAFVIRRSPRNSRASSTASSLISMPTTDPSMPTRSEGARGSLAGHSRPRPREPQVESRSDRRATRILPRAPRLAAEGAAARLTRGQGSTGRARPPNEPASAGESYARLTCRSGRLGVRADREALVDRHDRRAGSRVDEQAENAVRVAAPPVLGLEVGEYSELVGTRLEIDSP